MNIVTDTVFLVRYGDVSVASFSSNALGRAQALSMARAECDRRNNSEYGKSKGGNAFHLAKSVTKRRVNNL